MDSISELLKECESRVTDLDDWGQMVLDIEDMDRMAIIWDTMVKMKAIMSVMEGVFGPRMHDAIDNREGWVETPVGIYKRSYRGAKYIWDHDEALRLVTAYAAEHRELNSRTGEVETELQSFVRHLKRLGRINYWLYRDLKAIQIDADEFRTKEPGTKWITSV